MSEATTGREANPHKRLAFALWEALSRPFEVAEDRGQVGTMLAQAVVDAGWTPPDGETVDPVVPLALTIGRLRDEWRREAWRLDNEMGHTEHPTVRLDEVIGRLSRALTDDVGVGPLIDHDERVRARVLDDNMLRLVVRVAMRDPSQFATRDSLSAETDREWQDRALTEGLRRLRTRDGDLPREP